MIVGSGDIASVLTDRKDRVYFASGVSNSQEIRRVEYMRELDLLSKQNKEAHIVYFSTLALFYSDTRYTQHKRSMETVIKRYWKNYTIVRLGNIDWGTNPHTLINALRGKVQRGEPFELKDEWRYIVGKEEFLHWIDLIPEWNCELNIPGRRMSVQEVFDEYVKPYSPEV